MGDGGFGMTISELSTAVKYNINKIEELETRLSNAGI